MTARIINTPGTTPIDAITQIARELEQVALAAGYQIAVFYGSTTWKDHNNRRCLDTMISRISGATVVTTGKPVTPAQERELGDLIANYVWTHRVRLRLRWQIWRGRIRRVVTTNRVLRPINVWAPYFKPRTHFDHPHIEIESGPYAPPAEKPTPVATGLLTFYANEDGVKGYSKAGKVLWTREYGRKLTGRIQVGNGGEKYLVTTFGTWYPLARLSERNPIAVQA